MKMSVKKTSNNNILEHSKNYFKTELQGMLFSVVLLTFLDFIFHKV